MIQIKDVLYEKALAYNTAKGEYANLLKELNQQFMSHCLAHELHGHLYIITDTHRWKWATARLYATINSTKEYDIVDKFVFMLGYWDLTNTKESVPGSSAVLKSFMEKLSDT